MKKAIAVLLAAIILIFSGLSESTAEAEITWELGYWRANGSMGHYEQYCHSNYFPCQSGMQVICGPVTGVGGDADSVACIFVDADYKFICAYTSVVKGVINVEINENLSPDYQNIAYVSFCHNNITKTSKINASINASFRQPNVEIPVISSPQVSQNHETEDNTLKNKNIVILGDSIMMLMRSKGITTNGVIDQAKLDTQDWDALKEELGAATVLNLGLGGATVADTGDYDTDYPQPDSNSAYLTNEIRWLIRRVSEGHPTPDCIMIWLGTNGAGQPSSDNFTTVMAMPYDDFMSTGRKALRNTFYGGLRASLEMIYRNFPYCTVFIFSPIQTNPTNYRTYDALTITRDALKRMSDRYACIFVDALHEIGIVDFYENESNSTGRFLGDGLHPNAKGKVLMMNFVAKRLSTGYFAKQ